MNSGDYRSKANDLNNDIELSIAKYLMKYKDIKFINNIPIFIGEDNGVRCVFYNNTPIRCNSVEVNCDILERIENLMDIY